MFERFFFGGFVLLIAMTISPALSAAQPDANEARPRLTLPVAPENYPAASFIAHEEGHTVLAATIGADGRMSNARVETSSGYARLDEASIALANDAHLSIPPANAAGEAVSVEVFVDIIWKLPPESGALARYDSPQSGRGGLQRDPSSQFAVAHFRPQIDFTGYDKFVVEGPEISFREGWRRQHSRARLSDMERIGRERSVWFRDVFIEELQEGGRRQFVEDAGENVLMIRAGIGDLDVAAPILASDSDPGYSLSAEGTTATLVLELVDSASGEILARIFDRQRSAVASFDRPASRFSNETDARDIFTRWAEILRERLDELPNN